MKKWVVVCLAAAWVMAASSHLWADQPATVTLAVKEVFYGSTSNADAAAKTGTSIHDGEYLRTGVLSRAQLQLPSESVTRLGANTVFNYSAESNTVDLQAGTILFCKPKEAGRLNIKTAAVTAGIVGTTGFFSVHGEGRQTTYVLGLIEGHAIAHADDHPFVLGPGDALEFRPGMKPFLFAYDVPRFVKSSPLLSKSKYPGTLPNQSYIDEELVSYADDVGRGFITPPSKAIDYSGGIPVLSTVAYSSAQNARGMAKGDVAPPTPTPTDTPPPQQTQTQAPTTSPRGSGSPFYSPNGH